MMSVYLDHQNCIQVDVVIERAIQKAAFEFRSWTKLFPGKKRYTECLSDALVEELDYALGARANALGDLPVVLVGMTWDGVPQYVAQGA